MRSRFHAVLLVAVGTGLGSATAATAATADAQPAAAAPRAPSTPDDIARARALDQEGVRAFRDGHYNDAIRYFEEALKLGGPPTELWNIARCHLKLDEPEAAAEALEQFLASKDVVPQDRADARQQLDELKHRRSTITIASSPTGAYVAIDGRRIGRTPTSLSVAPGAHTIAVQREGFAPHVEDVDARFGRAVIVDARLVGGSAGAGNPGQDTPGADASPGDTRAVRRFTGSAVFAGVFPHLGGLGLGLHPAVLLGIGYVFHDWGRLVAAAGLRGTLAYDSWSNGVAAPALVCNIPTDEHALAYSIFADAALGYRVSDKLRVGGDVGLGLAAYPGSQHGGDLFEPSCDASPGIRPALRLGADVSYAVVPALRVLVTPLFVELQPAFDGARAAPVDTTGLWVRVGAGLGVAVDL